MPRGLLGPGRGLAGSAGFGLFHALGGLGHAEVVLHEAAGFDGISGADGAVEFTMDLGGFTEIAGVFDGFAAVVVEGGGDGFHEGGEDGIAGGLGDDAVKTDVVDEVFGGVVEGGEHLGDLFGEGGVVLLGAAVGG